MSREWRLGLLLLLFVWVAWYCARVAWVALTQGRLIDSRPRDGVPVTPGGKPVVFWFTVITAALFAPAFLAAAVTIGGDLFGFWRSDF